MPSVHVRRPDGSGYDYDEDVFLRDGNPQHGGERVLRLLILDADGGKTLRETRECVDVDEETLFDLARMTVEGDPEVEAIMQERAADEAARQDRILAGLEASCLACGCSETRACAGGCVWATQTLCSRCVAAERAVTA